MIAAAWRSPPDELSLATSEIHVWRVPLAQPPAAVEALAHTLADDERARAARFHFDRDRIAYIIARGAVRTLAGRYLACPPASLGFGYRDKGKPYLIAPPGTALRFNVSHSGAIGLVGFALGRELGVDVERRRPLSDLRALASTAFSPHEFAALCRLPPEAHEDAFFACWARKEAFIKATGEGVSQLADFDVSLAPDQPARLLRVAGELPGQTRWSLQDLPAIPGYAAALVVDGPASAVACWDWPASP